MIVKCIGGEFAIEKKPNKCPICHTAIDAFIIFGHTNDNDSTADVLMSCPDDSCKSGFLAHYERRHESLWRGMRYYHFQDICSPVTFNKRKFDDSITTISPMFSTIYNEAELAEHMKLNSICGVGYRKALEFLIKDYAIKLNPDDKASIEKNPLMRCINEYVNDDNVKTVAKRAVWLGNDETHYVRKWENKDVGDMKKLIELTTYWIRSEELTKQIENDMPE